MVITKDMLLSDIINKNSKAIEIFKKYGLGCCSCNGIYSESLEIAARVNDINLKEILFDLNNIMNKE